MWKDIKTKSEVKKEIHWQCKKCLPAEALAKEGGDEIEQDFGGKLVWERMEDNVTSRIKHQLDGVSVSNENDWPKMNEFLVDAAEHMHKAFKDPIRKINV